MGEDNKDEPLPGMLNATPEWMRVLPMAELQAGGAEKDAVFLQPDLPFNQLEQLFGGFAQPGSVSDKAAAGSQQFLRELLLEQSTPIVRSVAEYASQSDLATGAPSPQTPLDAAINNFPVGRLLKEPLARAVPGLFTADDNAASSPKYTVNIFGNKITVGETVANYVTGLGFRRVTPARMKSELRRRQDILEALLQEIKAEEREETDKQWEEDYGSMYPGLAPVPEGYP
jgi:hypothetical protein